MSNQLTIAALLSIIAGILIIVFPELVAWIIGLVLVLSGVGYLVRGDEMYKMN